jgi:hypothetical protein
MGETSFYLFKKISFKVADPIALIESYCFQNNFYANYDVVPIKEREIDHVNKIGARIGGNLLPRCKAVIENTRKLKMFEFDDNLDDFLRLDADKRNVFIKEFSDKAIKELLGKGIGLSKATKILHTFHPEIVPIIDNPLQELYKEKINSKWIVGEPEIFIDYYDNLNEGNNLQNLTTISKMLSKNNLSLTKVRIFDIFWWSYLKSKNLNLRLEKERRKAINWSTIK